MPVICPTPVSESERIVLAHGEGARLSRRLVRDELLAAFDNPFLRPLGDGAVLPDAKGRLVLTTDSYVVTPLVFPGGDIGRLAVHGTVNDLAVCGAEPLWLSVGLILEEGLPIETFRLVVRGLREAAEACGVAIVTGDTKVVPRGAVDGCFVNTTGVGRLRDGVELSPRRVRPGDAVLVSGPIGDHGIAVMAAREGAGMEVDVVSDSAPVHAMVAELLALGEGIRFLRDPTRGGVAAVLHELAESAGVVVILDEAALPVRPAVAATCEILGLDPVHVACEGRVVAIVGAEAAEPALAVLRAHALGQGAARIGTVEPPSAVVAAGSVLVRGALGVLRVLDEPLGAPLPRIC